MFASDRFAFETPNVIDPGDLPPSRPARSPEASSGESSDDERVYRTERSSTARLLRDINDLDLTNSNNAHYDPYRDDDDEEVGHSLPHADEARSYATSLLRSSHRREGSDIPPLSMDRTLKIDGSKHLVRRRVGKALGRVAAVGGLLVMGVLFGTLLGTRRATDASSGVTRREQVMEYLSTQGISDQNQLMTLGTPQSNAAKWMADQDPLQYPLPTQDPTTRFVQRYALAVLYYALHGEQWTHQLNFLSGTDECAWSHQEPTEFVGTYYDIGVSCDENLRPRNLFVPNNNLKGSLPPEIAQLSNLWLVSLAQNQITGSFPNAWQSLTNLIYLDVRMNEMNGTIPSFLGDCAGLEVLSLASNNFHGQVPNAVATLGRLKTLSLDDNALSGSLQFLNHLTQLEFLYADRNMFSGIIDENFLINAVLLREIDLSSNQISSNNFPSQLLQLFSLQVLDLSFNQLQGSLPNTLNNNDVLHYLSLRNNLLNGHVGANSLPNLSKLTHLDLYHNQFSGALPNTMRQLTSLSFLVIGFNNFGQQGVPYFLYDLTNLRELSLQGISLTGQIPLFFTEMSQLVMLDLSENYLHGTVPSELFDLPNLSYLLLNENDLTGTIPATFGGVKSLKVLTLHKNNFTGSVNQVCTEAKFIDVLGTDCTVKCDAACCLPCCQAGESNCFVNELNTVLTDFAEIWEFSHSRPTYAYDPAILTESGVARPVGR